MKKRHIRVNFLCCVPLKSINQVIEKFNKMVPEGGFEPPTRGFSIFEYAAYRDSFRVHVASMLHRLSQKVRACLQNQFSIRAGILQ